VKNQVYLNEKLLRTFFHKIVYNSKNYFLTLFFVKLQEQQNQARGSASGSAWWDRMKSFSVSTSSLKSSENIPQLKQEIVALEELSRQLFIDIHDLINMRERLEWSKTWQGKYFNFLGYFFSLYCTWKIFISTVNIVFNR
jgi:hypothetical protein